MDALLRDLKYAVRMLAKRPVLTGAAVLCLALGLGGTTVVFGFVDAVLLRPLPYPEQDRVMMIWNQFLLRDLPQAPHSGQEYEDHLRYDDAFDPIAGVLPWNFNLTSGEGDPERVVGGRASAALFDILGAEPRIGRVYSEEEVADQARVAVLGHGLWQRRFGGGEGVIGETLALDGVPYEVIGVLPEDFRFPLAEADLWVPFTPNPAVPRRARGVMLVGRLAPGVTPEQAQAELDRLADRFKEEFPDVYHDQLGYGMRLEPIRQEIAGDVRPLLLSLLGAVLLVLLIACANVANLQLARATERGKEISLRTALGARRGTLVRQLLTESVLLGLAGGAVGLVLAFFGTRALVAADLGDVPRLAEVGLDLRVLLFTLAVSVGTGLLFGLAPAWRAFRTDLVDALKAGGKTSSLGGGRHPLRTALVVVEVALALTVLVGAGLMLRSFQQVSQIDPGFATEGLLTAELAPSRRAYRTPDRLTDLYRQLRERLGAAPEVRDVAVTAGLPLQLGLSGSPEVEGWEPGPGGAAPVVGFEMVSPEYFGVMGLERVAGRLFTDSDNAQSPRVVIVDRELADTYWPDGGVQGQRLRLPGLTPPGEWLRVVGVVESLEIEGLSQLPERRLYIPFPQAPQPRMTLVMETAGEPMSAAGTVRRTVWSLDPEMPIVETRRMEDVVAESVARPKVNAALFTAFGLVALLLASVGVYGVMAYSVAQRTREIGVRMALGAEQGKVRALVVGRGMLLTAAGLVGGLVLAFLVARALAGVIGEVTYGVGATDWVTFLAVPAVLAAVAFLASYLPARRATKVNPLEALRYE